MMLGTFFKKEGMRYICGMLNPYHMMKSYMVHSMPNLLFVFLLTIGMVWPRLWSVFPPKLLVWEIDPSMDQIRPLGTESTCSFVYTWRAAHIEAFRKAGFQNVAYLPLATDTQSMLSDEGKWKKNRSMDHRCLLSEQVLWIKGAHYRDVFLSSYAQWSGKKDGEERLRSLMQEQAQDWSSFLVPCC